MKLIGIKEYYNITRAKVISALNCAIVVAVCSTATFVIDSALDYKNVQAQPVVTEVEVTVTVISTPDETETEDTGVTETAMASTEAAATEYSETSAPSESSSDTAETEEPTNTPTPAETSAATTTTTAETTEAVTEKELYLAVYATTTINVRKGPGTEYDVVKSVYTGDQIDVIAVTSNGWYKTYNGNYVKKSLTTETKPSATPTPKPKLTAKPTSKPTSSTKATESQKPAPSGETHNCKITFYGPQPTANGGYSKSTATGTTCVEGQTCAADWSIYPAGTVIYIANDPLGGDGYYTVEDKGGGVKGYHIDIYAEDGETGNHSTCWRDVTSQ